MPVVNPGIRRFLGSAIQRLFNGASFSAPLTHSAIPTRAASGTTGTFTRATTATVRDNEGVLRTAIAGEARFEGARRVRNLLTYTENFSNAAWSVSNATMTANQAAAPDGVTTADLFTATANAQQTVWFAAGIAGVYSTVYSAYVKAGTATWLNFTLWDGAGVLGGGIQVWFNLFTGAVGSSVVGAGFSLTGTSTESVGNGWYRIAIAGTATGGAFVPAFRITDSNGVNATTATNGKTFYIWGAQLEDVTAQTTQTAGEYVSVGVASSPYYHGSMVDGVKCFATDINGAAIPSSTLLGYQAEGARTNLCLQSNAFTTTWLTTGTPTPTQNAVGPDGATSAWTLTDADGVDASVYQGLTLTAAAWTASVFVKKTTGAQTSYPVLVFYPSDGTQVQAATVDTTNGVVTDWTSFTASTMAAGRSVRISSFNDDYWRVELTKTGTAATHYFQLLPAGTTAPTYAGPTISTAATGSAVFYGAQVELGSFASSYIPTTTIAVARNADVLTYSSAGNISETAGSVYGELSTLWTTSTTNIAVSAATNSYPLGVNNNSISTIIVNRDGTNFSSKTSLSDMSTGVRKRAGSWSATGIAVTGDGASPGTASYDGAYGVGASLGVGNLADGSLQWFGTIRNVRIWQRQLSASELQAITS